MTDDILAQAEKICKVLSEVSQHWRNQSNAVLVVAGDLLPQLLAEAKQLAVEMKAALAQIEALKDKLAEERAKILMAGEDEVAEAWEYLKDNPNFINDAYQQLKADPDLKKAGVEWE